MEYFNFLGLSLDGKKFIFFFDSKNYLYFGCAQTPLPFWYIANCSWPQLFKGWIAVSTGYLDRFW